MYFSGRHYSEDLILQTVRWYLRYNLSYRDMVEILEERGVEIDYTKSWRKLASQVSIFAGANTWTIWWNRITGG